ncbi:MAG: calcium-binding protein [Pseudomonadota bacterium]
MTDFIETGDQNGTIFVGDTFSGGVAGADTRDNIYMGMDVGETYTFSLDLSATTGTLEFAILNPFTFEGSRIFIVDGTFFEHSVQNSSIGTFSAGELNGTTVTFDFTPSIVTTYQFEITAHGGNAFDYTVGFNLADPYGVSDGNDVVTGLATADDVALLRGDDSMDAGGGDDTITANNGDDTVNGDGGNDDINGGSGFDLLNGGTGDDTLNGASGQDTLSGGGDNDELRGSNGSDDLSGDAGDDMLDGGKGDDVMDGGAGNDTLSGSFGDDTMTGGTEADLFNILPGGGADVITDFDTGVDTIDIAKLGISAFTDLAMTDTVDGVVIDFGAGDSLTLTGLTAADLASTDFALAPDLMLATNGDDTMKGTDDANIMSGLDGADRMQGKGGDDVLNGDAGRDFLDGDSGNDTLNGGGDNDKLLGDAGQDELNGGQRNDRLHGGDDNDVLNGGHGNDYLKGDAGNDTLNGGTGKDKMTGGTGIDTFVFANKSGRDQITDFENGIDVMDFTAVTGVTGIADLAIAQDGTGVVISYGGNNTLTLDNTALADIDGTDFLF